MRYVNYSIAIILTLVIIVNLSGIGKDVERIFNFSVDNALEEEFSDLLDYSKDDFLETLEECDYDIELESRSDVTNCNNPNGKLAIRNTVESLNATYSIIWYNSEGTIVSRNSQASNLDIGTYLVYVTKNTTGCTVSKTYYVGVALPTLSAQVIKHVDDCVGNTSHIRVELGGVFPPTDKYTVTVHNGPTTQSPILATMSGSSGFTRDMYGLAPGSYAVTISGTGSNNCRSTPTVLIIEDRRVYPQITLSSVNNTMCAPNTPNGSLTGSVVGGPAGYSFEWFSGANTLDANRVGTAATANNLAAGTYTLRVTNTTTRCASTTTGTVANATITPVVTVNKVADNTNCITPNGVLNASVGGVTSGYTFRWYIGSTVKVSPDFTGTSYPGLIHGPYTVTAINSTTACISNPVTISVLDMRVFPTLTLSNTPNSNCADATPNGSASVTISQGNTGHTIEWFAGGLPISGSSIGSGNTLPNRTAGSYSVRVTNTASGCFTTATTTVADVAQIPVINFTKVEQTFCAPANGNITISSITEGGASQPLTNYTISLLDINGASVSGSGGAFTGLMAGTYYLRAENNTSRCRSIISQIAILDRTLIPTVSFTRVNNGSCNPAEPNGSITAAASTSADVSGTTYTYQWFAGGLPISTSSIATGSSFADIAGGQYTVRAINTTTGCYLDATTSIINKPIYPVLTFTTTDETYCTPNGTITLASITEDGTPIDATLFSEYNLTLYHPDGTTEATTGENSFANLASGTYYVEGAHSIKNCLSVRYRLNIGEAIVYPVLSETIENQTSCDPGNPNGSISVTADGSTGSEYVFEWFNGTLPIASGATPVYTGANLTGLIEGNYTLRVTNTTTTCIVYDSYYVDEVLTIPVVTTDTEEVSDCMNPNGSITATLQAGLDPNDYYFYWYIGTEIKATPDFPITVGNILLDLPIGDYRVVAEHKINKCQSTDNNSIAITLDDDIKVVPEIKGTPAACEADGGALKAIASSVNNQEPTGMGFTFTWYEGTLDNLGDELNVGHPDYASLNITNTLFDSNIEGLPIGYYSVKVVGNDIGCENWATEYLPYEETPATILTPTNANFCQTFDGTVTAEFDPINSSAAANLDPTAYIFEIYEGNYVTGTPIQTIDGDVTPITFTNLKPGIYTVGSYAKLPPNCPSEPVTIEVGTNTRDPLFSKRIVNPNTYCGPYNGSIDIGITPDPDDNASSYYKFTWFDKDMIPITSNVTSSSYSGATEHTSMVTNLVPGVYTVRIDNLVTFCDFETTFTIEDNPEEIVIVVDPTDQSFCSPKENGLGTISSVTRGGVADDPNDYTYEIFDAGFNSLVTQNYTSLVFSDLAEGSYYVLATSNTTHCLSEPFNLIIDDISADPVVVVASTNPDQSCNAQNPTGVLTATDVDNGEDPNDYTFTWRDSNGTILLSGDGEFTVTGLLHGRYSLEITDKTTTCSSITEHDIDYEPSEIRITASSVNNTWCGPVDFNGEGAIQVYLDEVLETDVSGYSFTWVDQSGNTVNTTSETDAKVDLAPGIYYLTAKHVLLGCNSDPISITIQDDSVDPVIVIAQSELDISCNGIATGALEVTEIDGIAAPNFSNYNFKWWNNDAPSVPLGSAPYITGQPAGFYTVEIQDVTTECDATAEYYLVNDPAEIVLFSASATQHNTMCVAPYDGAATVNEVRLNGVTDSDLTNYTLNWYDENYALIHVGVSIPNLNTGLYYVKATHNDLLCPSDFYPVRINDITVDPVIVFDPSTPNISCDPTNPTGSLSATLNGVSDFSDYAFTWYDENDVIVTPNASDDKLIENLPAGTYKFDVLRISTGCTASAIAVVEDDQEMGKPVFSLIDGHPQDCQPSGSIQITGPDLSQYTFEWYSEFNASLQSIGTTPTVPGLVPGLYYVIATDINLGCKTLVQTELLDQSVPPAILFDPNVAVFRSCIPGVYTGQVKATVDGINGNALLSNYDFKWYTGMLPVDANNLMVGESSYLIDEQDTGYYSVEVYDRTTTCTSWGTYYIRDGREFPNIEVEVLGNKNCDPARQNGAITAFTDPELEDHTFTWYVGEITALSQITESPIGNNPLLEGLSSQWYTVVIQNIGTQCISLLPVFVPDSIEVVPMPIATVLEHTDNCEFPNGAMTAAMAENPQDYEYYWYYGNTVSGDAFLGADYNGLNPGFYTVVSKEIETGCFSEPVTVEIEDKRVYPVYRIKTKNATCMEDNGTVEIIVEEGHDIASIQVKVGDVLMPGPLVTDLTYGDYEVVVTSTKGCATSSMATVGIDIIPYNGVSPNSDGQNDFFIVDCLQDYPNNIVKIFNRAGALVYEIEGYDNKDIYFDGLGNRGLYVNKKLVPDGTYFYVVDKRDGSNPKTGYLELSR